MASRDRPISAYFALARCFRRGLDSRGNRGISMITLKDGWFVACFTALGASVGLVAVVFVPGVGLLAAIVGPAMSTTLSGAILGALAGTTAGSITAIKVIEQLRGAASSEASTQHMARLYQEMSDDFQLCRALTLSAAAHCDDRAGRALQRKRNRLLEALNGLAQGSLTPEMRGRIDLIVVGEIDERELARALNVLQPAQATCEKLFHAAVRLMTAEDASLTTREATFLARFDELRTKSGGMPLLECDAEGRIDLARLIASALEESVDPIAARHEDAKIMDVFPDASGRTPAERVVGHLLSAAPNESSRHEHWIEAFRELATHGALTTAPWRDGRSIGRLPHGLGDGFKNVSHGLLLRSGVDLMSRYLHALDDLNEQMRDQNLGMKQRLVRYAAVNPFEGASLSVILTSVGANVTAVSAVEAGHQLFSYLEAAPFEALMALRCATHAIADGFDALRPNGMTANERSALLLKSLISAGLIVGTEMIEHKIRCLVTPYLPGPAAAYAELITKILLALGLTAAMYAVARAVDGALAVEVAKRRQAVDEGLAQLTGRTINEHHMRLFLARHVARADLA